MNTSNIFILLIATVLVRSSVAADSLQELALIQRVYPSVDARYFPDPVVVQKGLPVEFYITTIQREHQNRVSVEPFFVTTEPVVPGKIRATLFVPNESGDFAILNLGHEFTGTLSVVESADEVLSKRAEGGFQEFSLIYGTDGIFPSNLYVQKDVPIKLHNIGLRENHTVSLAPFLPGEQLITPNDVSTLEFIPDRLGNYVIRDQTYDMTANLIVVNELPPVLACDFNHDIACNPSDLSSQDGLYSVGDLVSGVEVAAGNAIFDLTADGIINSADLGQWLATAASENGFSSPFLAGDTDLNGSVGFDDFLQLANNFGTGTEWAQGNFHGSGTVHFGDFLALANQFGNEISAVAVPEPIALPWPWISLVLLTVERRRLTRRSNRTLDLHFVPAK